MSCPKVTFFALFGARQERLPRQVDQQNDHDQGKERAEGESAYLCSSSRGAVVGPRTTRRPSGVLREPAPTGNSAPPIPHDIRTIASQDACPQSDVPGRMPLRTSTTSRRSTLPPSARPLHLPRDRLHARDAAREGLSRSGRPLPQERLLAGAVPREAHRARRPVRRLARRQGKRPHPRERALSGRRRLAEHPCSIAWTSAKRPASPSLALEAVICGDLLQARNDPFAGAFRGVRSGAACRGGLKSSGLRPVWVRLHPRHSVKRPGNTSWAEKALPRT